MAIDKYTRRIYAYAVATYVEIDLLIGIDDDATTHVTLQCPWAPKCRILAAKAILPFGATALDERTGKP